MTADTLKRLENEDLPVPGADPWFVHSDDAAVSVMTDFRERASITISETTPIDVALENMKHAGVRCAFVTNALRRVIGLITAYDIVGEAPIRFMQLVGVQRTGVLVSDVMVKLENWRVLELRDLEKMTVGSLCNMFELTKLTHIPVMESNAGAASELRGLLSAAKLRRVMVRQTG